MSKHFCGGIEKGVSLYVDAPACCPMEEPGDADGCCKNENKVFVEDFCFVCHEASVDFQPEIVATSQPVFGLVKIESVNQLAHKRDLSPPPDIISEYHILFSQFII